ncbi:hypothetical protein [Candidatus Poriferisocius sp.]|uniref:hypothetical protein n=1 Tax=Candidatus Poriferisocius sp. TaxID=3101276 RepID=UPI003B01F385
MATHLLVQTVDGRHFVRGSANARTKISAEEKAAGFKVAPLHTGGVFTEVNSGHQVDLDKKGAVTAVGEVPPGRTSFPPSESTGSGNAWTFPDHYVIHADRWPHAGSVDFGPFRYYRPTPTDGDPYNDWIPVHDDDVLNVIIGLAYGGLEHEDEDVEATTYGSTGPTLEAGKWTATVDAHLRAMHSFRRLLSEQLLAMFATAHLGLWTDRQRPGWFSSALIEDAERREAIDASVTARGHDLDAKLRRICTSYYELEYDLKLLDKCKTLADCLKVAEMWVEGTFLKDWRLEGWYIGKLMGDPPAMHEKLGPLHNRYPGLA